MDTFPIMRPYGWTENGISLEHEASNNFEFYDFPHLKRPIALPQILGFDDGLPDVRLAPINELASTYARNLRQLALRKI